MAFFNIHSHQKHPHLTNHILVNMIVGRDKIAQDSSFCNFSYGIHPWYIFNVEEQLLLLKELAHRADCIAIGEAGLDKYASTPIEKQKLVFMAQAELAEELCKPLVIHCVKCWGELIACRKEIKPHTPWIIHGFRGNGILARQLIRLGFYLSFGYRFNSTAIQQAWPDRLFLETDDQSVDIQAVYFEVAKVLGVKSEQLSIQIEKNISILHLGR